ncbi:MAG: alpha/beta hydrolase [Hyphomicrobiales bacterium]|nr:alpha/beta hydrolase [Hyphomicrobiales bacterium]
MRIIAAAVAALLICPPATSALARGANAGGMSIEDTFMKVRIKDSIYRLNVLIVGKTGGGRKPVALLTHGKPLGQLRMSTTSAMRYLPIARDFAWRGYLAVVVVRRGFGRSDGPLPVTLGCSATDLAPRFEAAADDLEAVVKELAKRPDADISRVIALGASAGGAAVTALAARNLPGLKAVINISGGLSFPKCPKENELVSAYARYGKSARAPALWLYSANDRLFPASLVDRMHEAYLNGGGDVQRQRIGSFTKDGHALFSTRGGRRIWLRYLDGFLRSRDLPTWDLDDVRENMKDIGMTSASRVAMETYLSLPGVKAMAYSRSAKRVIAYFGRNKLEVVRSRAYRACKQRTGNDDCRIVMENFAVLPKPAEMSLTAAPDPDSSMVVLRRLGIDEKRIGFLEDYLDARDHKVLVKSLARKYYSYSSSQKSFGDARRKALARCDQRTGGPCKVVMEGDRLVEP